MAISSLERYPLAFSLFFYLFLNAKNFFGSLVLVLVLRLD